MPLHMVGLGLGSERDITLRGLDAIKLCTKVYLEAYTSILGVDTAKLEALYGKPVELADRERVEQARRRGRRRGRRASSPPHPGRG